MSLAIIISLAALLDLLIGDPRWMPHPVIGIGKGISAIEKRWNIGAFRKGKGILLVLITIGFLFTVTWVITYIAYQIHVVAGVLAEAFIIFTTIAIKGLQAAAMAVYRPLKEGDFRTARKALSGIVGRDTEHLDEQEITRGVVETVAENTVDGITAPLFWALIGGAPLAMVYRGVNTLDSMVGYRNERYEAFGWASARLDDLLNWIPAKVTALCMWSAAVFIEPDRLIRAMKVTFRDASKHPSPNSGWPEAMVAGLLGIQLGGKNTYDGVPSYRPTLGDSKKDLEHTDIKRTIRLMHGAWLFFLFIHLGLYMAAIN